MGFFLSLLPESYLWVGCLSAVVLIGVPHGALDICLLWTESQKDASILFRAVLKYVLLVIGSLGVWRISSDLFWFCFFFAAVYHFGSTDEHPQVLRIISKNSWNRVLWVLSRGTLLVFAPAAFHPEKVIGYLNQAASPSFAIGLTSVASFLCVYSGLIYLWTSLNCYKKSSFKVHRFILLKHLCSVSVFILLFWVADPLVSFSLYFCCHHSLNHSFRVLNRNPWKKSNLYLVLVMIALTLSVLPLMFWARGHMKISTIPKATVAACFIAVAALTFPHLLVVKRLHEKLIWLDLD